MKQALLTATQVLHQNVKEPSHIPNALPWRIDVGVAPRKHKRRYSAVFPIGCDVLGDDGSSILGPKSLAVILICSLSLIITSASALAQPGPEPNSATLAIPLSEGQVRTKATEWHTQCLRDWDQQTHMTKEDWFRACQRTVDERVQWLRQWLRGQEKGATHHRTSPRGVTIPLKFPVVSQEQQS
jgi:hypothetical protein